MLTGIVVAAVLVAVFLLVPWVAQRMQGMAGDSSGGSGPFGALDEVFHPSAHRVKVAEQQLKEQAAPAPAPGDDPDPGPGDLTEQPRG